MQLKDLLVEAGTGAEYLVFGSAERYPLVIYFNNTIADKAISDKDAARKAINNAIEAAKKAKRQIKDDATEEGFGALIHHIHLLYDSYHSNDGQNTRYYRSECKKHDETLKSALETAIKAGDIPGIDKTTKVVRLEHPL